MIVKADAAHTALIVEKVSERITKLGGKPFRVEEFQKVGPWLK